MKRTPEEIEKLKKNWKHDPCWDIEDTEGFEEHREELLAYRLEENQKAEAEMEKERITRIMDVQAGTGIENATIALSIHTFQEIENDLCRLYQSDFVSTSIRIAEVRANLLLAAQVARLADALEGTGEIRVINNSWGDK